MKFCFSDRLEAKKNCLRIDITSTTAVLKNGASRRGCMRPPIVFVFLAFICKNGHKNSECDIFQHRFSQVPKSS